MICLIALVVFSVCGIFSVRYRRMAKMAFDCVFRRLTLRKCDTSFDKKMKMKVTTKLHKRNERLGSFVHRHFEVISWFFTIIMIASLAYSAYSVYNLVVFGSCDPTSDICILNPTPTTCGSEHCAEFGCTCEEEGCEAPEFEACNGSCDCVEGTCS